jgi:hypothetical protein
MQYALLIYNPAATWSGQPSQDEMQKTYAAYKAFTEAMKSAGAYTASHGLAAPSAATTVRVANGKSQVLNGPYADSKEQLGGIYLIDVPDLDAALQWAARCPSAAFGAVEVRPLWGS